MNDLLNGLLAATNQTESWLWATLLVFVRVGAVMALLPAFGEQSVPQRVRLALTVCFTMIIAPAVVARAPGIEEGFALPLATEVAAGLALGIGFRMFVFALQIAGTLVAQSTSLSQLFGGQGAEPQPAISHVFVMAGLALAVASGLHVRVAEVLILSYNVLPFGIFPDSSILSDWGVAQIRAAFSLAFSMAAPFLAASLIYNIALGVINRAMPQLMVVLVGAPALTLGGLVLMAIATPLMLSLWMTALDAYLANPYVVAP
ncbi:flagellar biosynthetic protein FliR [Pseudorhodobacter turbinis]|uniref:Flagellar biosynthetic protein FliR n=1 Tax=Pseudorhodobacter turbinis TaxID=2500533 RepID=A0A4P8EGN4_9RHOB|nr:flagellar biosynthetic protein FliR [Pseudorhodobacter turbinis]QCO55695.1 flagellar biosynthetic protein FliR [Pseudorhodobacter turbinis]